MSQGAAQLIRARHDAALALRRLHNGQHHPLLIPRGVGGGGELASRRRRIPLLALFDSPAHRAYSSSSSSSSSKDPRSSSTPTQSWEEIAQNEDIKAELEADDRKRNAPPPSLVSRLEEVPVRRHGSQTILIKPLTRYEGYNETRGELQRYHRAMRRQERLHERYEDLDPADWREVLETLMEWTPRHEPDVVRAKVLLLRRGGQGQGSKEAWRVRISDRIWDIPSRTGVEMMMTGGGSGGKERGKDRERKEEEEEEGEDQGDTYLWLSGRAGNLDQALKEILEVTREITVIRLSNSGDEEAVLEDAEGRGISRAKAESSEQNELEGWTVRQAGSVFAPKDVVKMRSEKVAELVRGMRKPEAWTKQNFLDWIIYLTNSKVDKSFARIAYAGKEGGHQARVLSQLREAFFSPVSSGKASNPALKVALRYLAKSGATHIDLAHELHDRAADLGIKMDTGVWNFLLECSVKAKDLLGFRARLRRMISKGFVPSFRTWILFLRLVEADEVKRYVIQGIHMKGYLSSPGFVQRVADEMMDSDAYRAGKLGLSWEAHLDGLQKLYGPDWIFTISNANKTIAQYVRNDQFAQALRVVEYMFETKEKDYQKPNEITMNTLLQSCHIQRRADRALTVLRVFEKNGRLGVADDVAYHYLFELAWKLRRPHMLAAVWRYAHLVNKVSARMRHRGLSILQGGEAVDRFRLPWHVAATQKEVMEKLLLWDYKMEGFDTDPPAAEEEEEEEEEQTEANATTTMMNSTTTATEIIPKTAAMRAKEQEVVSILATPLDEQPEAMKSGGLTDALNKTTGVPISPRLRQRYRGFEEWSLGRYLIGVPGTSLSRFLEKAAEEDEKLLEAVKKGGGVAPAGEVEAPELPVRIRDRAQQADLIKRMRRLDHGSGSGGGGGGGGSSSEGGSQRFKAILEFAEKATGL